MYSNTLINITKKRKNKSIINNTEYHDTRGNGLTPAGGSQIEEYRIYNTEIVPTVQGFNKYIKTHGHIGNIKNKYKTKHTITTIKSIHILVNAFNCCYIHKSQYFKIVTTQLL